MLHFIFADLRRNAIGVAIVALLVALATALGVAVTLQERALRLGSARASAAFDLVIGAAGSETQLVLSSVFLQAAPLPLLEPGVLSTLRADPRIERAIPIGFGDFVDNHPVIGTTAEALNLFGGLSQGSGFVHTGDAVAGALVRREIGATFHPFHGIAGEAGTVHAEVEYRITGRLHPTGTPWDRAILVPIQSVWHAHAHEEESSAAHAEEKDDGHGHAHDGEETGEPLDEASLTRADNPGVPAVLVKPRSIADAYNIRQEYRKGATVAVFPGEVLTRLYGTLGDARRILGAVAGGAQGLVAAAILMVIAIHVLQRRRQIGALRAFGAPRAVVMAMVWLEVFAILACGLIAGFAIGYAAVHLLSRRLAEASGVAMPVIFQPSDLLNFSLLLGFAALATLVPVLIAYRQSPAQSLRG